MKRIAYIIILSLSIVFFSTCNKFEVKPVTKVETGEATHTSSTTIIVTGKIIDLSNEDNTDHGFCYATHNDPTIDDFKVSKGKPRIGVFDGVITDFSEGIEYYVRAYASNSMGTVYGNQVSVITILCITENTGDVIVTNNSTRTLWFDVTDSYGNTNENHSIQPGANLTYTVPAGKAKVWAASENVTTSFYQVGEIDLAQCATENFSYTEATVAITNSTGFSIEIAVEDDFTTTGVFTLANNYIRTFYNMPADRAIYLGIRIPGIIYDWVWAEEYLEANETFQWTWTYSKYLTAKSANIQRADPGTVVTRSKR